MKNKNITTNIAKIYHNGNGKAKSKGHVELQKNINPTPTPFNEKVSFTSKMP